MSAAPLAGIRLRGVRQNNLKSINLDLPLRQLIVIAGLSGSGKSSLAFETLFAEGQRRYIETFSPYARQFLDRMDKPQADSIIGIPPAIAIEQRNTVKTTRSTVGTMTEITEYAKLFWPYLAQIFCRQCNQPVRKEPPQLIWDLMRQKHAGQEVLVAFDLVLSEKFSLEESLALIAKQGYQRLFDRGQVINLADAASRLKKSTAVTVVQDRVRLTDSARSRFIEACEQAYHFGKGKLALRVVEPDGNYKSPLLFSNRRHCAQCDLDFAEPTAALFSFNHPLGACPACRGFGRIIAIDYEAAIPDRSKTLAGGAVKPWQTPSNAECQDDLMRLARRRKVPVDLPFRDLPANFQQWVIEGDPDYRTNKANSWYGIKGYFRWLESRAYKMHVRVLLSRYRLYKPCPECKGTRFGPDTLLYRIDGKTLADFYRMSIRDALRFIDALAAPATIRKNSDPMAIALGEVRARLAFLDDVGLSYLTLDRQTRTLSGGETERVNLTACLGSRLVNTLFVLDEPSVGLHPRDTARLVRILRQLRDAGNTVAVVEHEASVIRAADRIIELGPGRGEAGGHVVFEGTCPEMLRHKRSLTGAYLSGRVKISPANRREVKGGTKGKLVLRGATLHNLKDVSVEIPLGRFVCVTGVSGSGKTTLIRDVLTPALLERLQHAPPRRAEEEEKDDDENAEDARAATDLSLSGWENLSQVVIVDQSALGRTPRSNAAVYTGAFDPIREFFADREEARQRGLTSSSFSFNSAQGQCERCRGAGFEKIEMQFLSDIFIRCPDCQGRRYRPHILEVTIPDPVQPQKSWSIADLLEATIDDGITFLRSFPDSKAAQNGAEKLALLQELGLGYLRLGQPLNTLSGGESQRLKLVAHLAEARDEAPGASGERQPALFIFDEPTTGLHFDDIRILLQALQRLVEAGHSVLVVEHNLDVIRSADWVIDLGPEAGEDGGRVVAVGTPEAIAQSGTHTGRALAEAVADA
jgi:excinuclease ABC subunit A